MGNKEVIKERMLKEGFIVINEYNDPPNEFFPDHDHPGGSTISCCQWINQSYDEWKNFEFEAWRRNILSGESYT